MIIGNRQKFAIEVTDYEEREGKVRFWINNSDVGDLKVKDELETCANALKRLIEDKDELYDEVFELKTEAEIFQYCLLLDSNPSNRTEKDYERFRAIQHLSPFLGEQFDSCTKVIYFKEGYYHFLWSCNNDYTSEIDYMENFKVEKIRDFEFESVCNDFYSFLFM